MELELEFGTALCYTPTFVINGIRADSYDFGEQYDWATEDAEEYACGGMQFTRVPARPEVLTKYGITGPEYELIAGQLEVGLSFGSCGWCVWCREASFWTDSWAYLPEARKLWQAMKFAGVLKSAIPACRAPAEARPPKKRQAAKWCANEARMPSRRPVEIDVGPRCGRSEVKDEKPRKRTRKSDGCAFDCGDGRRHGRAGRCNADTAQRWKRQQPKADASEAQYGAAAWDCRL